MTDATYQTNAVRLRARFESGQALVEHLRRRADGKGVEPTGVYRRAWPHDLQITGRGIHGIKAIVAALPLAKFAADPDEAEAFAGLMPRREEKLPPTAGVEVRGGGRADETDRPARRGYLAAHFNTREDS
ncbi:hypothetical protein FHP25_24850 [Vineibacter terrae]|uniref:Uncharacterized protein n=1 Tax=Vineibacter terrae TaxID=2586908 RepID=A0A5C8PFH3_9HYPH|nr:hypothetical protein [Vineibacter terrae]TXL72527.1 hypothetical protein FHP25_24850 [Vineibacter terrae]